MEWLNYHHLLYFWSVAREGNLTRASRQLHLTPQTVSAQIRSLETAFDAQLFDRRGRRLVLTEVGRLAFGYAEEIFGLGRELQRAVRERPTGRPVELVVGVVDVLPKLIAHHLLEPALELGEPVRIVCREAAADELLGQLAVHRLDVVLSDTPLPPGLSVRAFNHPLGECGVAFVAEPALAGKLRRGFPDSLDGAPLLLPTADSVLRRSLDQWLDDRGLQPQITGEFQDSALLKVFGQAGVGAFCIPAVLEREVCRQYGARPVGRTDDVVERFYAISPERRVRHPAVAAICETARRELFAEA
jgi:LysR family transcriptional activator of nhaA